MVHNYSSQSRTISLFMHTLFFLSVSLSFFATTTLSTTVYLALNSIAAYFRTEWTFLVRQVTQQNVNETRERERKKKQTRLRKKKSKQHQQFIQNLKLY